MDHQGFHTVPEPLAWHPQWHALMKFPASSLTIEKTPDWVERFQFEHHTRE